MTTKKLDFKKEFKELYLPKAEPALIDVPAMNFIMIDGQGDPNAENGEYQQAVETLYTLAYAIKMSAKKGQQPEGYFEYVVPPLEGLWWVEGDTFDFNQRDNWRWTSLIRQPEFVTPTVFDWAVTEAHRKKPGLDFSQARLESFQEGLCVQMLHIGPYAEEPATVAKMQEYMEQQGLVDLVPLGGKHHEIYLTDPRKSTPEKMKTVVRHPVARQ